MGSPVPANRFVSSEIMRSHMGIIHAGILQFDIQCGHVSANLKTAADGIRRLAGRGADLVLLPEMWASGFDLPRLSHHAENTPDVLGMLTNLAREHNLVIAGSLPESDDGGIYNSMYIVSESGVLSKPYRKMHLFRPTAEDRHFAAGDQVVVTPTRLGALGTMICYDLRFPELCRMLSIGGADIVLISAQWPSRRIHHWDALLRARAIENQIFIVASNRCGRQNDLSFIGHSQVISPQGEILCFLDDKSSEGLAVIDLSEIASYRQLFNTVAEQRLLDDAVKAENPDA
jgi:omega-amidase